MGGVEFPLLCFGFYFVNLMIAGIVYKCMKGGRCHCFPWEDWKTPNAKFKKTPFIRMFTALVVFSCMCLTFSLSPFVFLSSDLLFLPFFLFPLSFPSSDTSIVTVVLQYFNCVKVVDERFLYIYPSVSCDNDPQYKTAEGWIYFLMVFVAIGFPAFLFSVLCYGYCQKKIHSDVKFKQRYGSLFVKLFTVFLSLLLLLLLSSSVFFFLPFVGMKSTNRNGGSGKSGFWSVVRF
jgi:hypothetical protein